jgi:hypothetical protein
MPSEWATALLTSPQQFCLQLTPTQVDTFQAAEASHFFFDVAHEPTEKRGRPGAVTARKPTEGETLYRATALKLRRNPLRYLPTSTPEPTLPTAVKAEEAEAECKP